MSALISGWSEALLGTKIFIYFLFSLTSLSRLFHSYRDESISRWGKTGLPRENHLTHEQADLDLSHMSPMRGSNPHQPQRWDYPMIKDDNEISHLNNSATGAAPGHPDCLVCFVMQLFNLFSQMQKADLLCTALNMVNPWCSKLFRMLKWIFCIIWAASWENQQSAYAKTKTQISFVVTAKLISAFVFATWIVQYLFFLNSKFQASSHLQWLHSLVCVRPGQNPHCWFSHDAAQMFTT